MNKKLFSKVFVLLRKIQSYHLSIFGEKGAALVTSILFATVIGVGALVATQNMVQDIERGERYTQTRETFYIAEAGIQTAMNYLNYDDDGESPGDAGDGFTEVLANFETNRSEALDSFDFGGGTYTVTVKDNDDNDGDPSTDADNTIILSSTGIKDGRNITIEAVIQNGIYRNKHAITSGGNLTIEGDPTVQGNLGSIHSNADVVGISSNVEQGIFAVGECEEGCESGAISEEIPLANPSDFSSYANFILTANGDITNAAGEDVDIKKNQLENWSFSNAGWELEGCSGHGMFYSETGVRLTGSIEKCSDQESLPQTADSCQQDIVNLQGSRENIALVKLYLSKASESDRIQSEQSLRNGLSCDDFVQNSEVQSLMRSFDNFNRKNRRKGIDRKNQRKGIDRKNQRKGIDRKNQRQRNSNRAELDNRYNFFIRNVSFQKSYVPVELSQLLDQNLGQNGNEQGLGQNQEINQSFGLGGQCDPGLACDPASGTCCGQCDPAPACVADDPNAIPCCGSESGNGIENGQADMNLTGRSENIVLVSRYLSQIPEEYRNELEQSFGDNLDCDEFVERPDFQAFMNPKYVENNENQCSDSDDNSINNLGGMTLTGRNENVLAIRRYLRQLPKNERRQLQQRFRNGLDCDDFVQSQNVQAFMESENSNSNSGEPLSLTLVAEEDIFFSATANIQNFKNPDNPEEIQNLLFLAGGDIDLGGNLTNTIDGIVIAAEQISLAANANLSGYVIASDIFNESSMVTESKVFENFTVTYNDLKNPFLNDQTKILSWKQ
jgi:hypothetical protein